MGGYSSKYDYAKKHAGELRNRLSPPIVAPVGGPQGPQGPQGLPGSSLANYVGSAPPVGNFPVTNLYWNPITQKLIGEYDDGLLSNPLIYSNPPEGYHMITNIYFDPVTGRVTCEYEDGT